MSSTPSRELAELLLRKAAQDEFVLERLAPDPATPEEVIGFHAQQAVEKMLKAVLAVRGIHYRYTHDLVELIDLVRAHGFEFPPELDEAPRLAPFAAAFRYDELPAEPEELFDVAWALSCVGGVRAWAEPIVRGQEGDAP